MDRVGFARRLLMLLNEMRLTATSNLTEGRPQTLEKYRECVGEYRGLERAIYAIVDELDENERQDLKLPFIEV